MPFREKTSFLNSTEYWANSQIKGVSLTFGLHRIFGISKNQFQKMLLGYLPLKMKLSNDQNFIPNSMKKEFFYTFFY